mgnify:CR=1 FL=1
MSLGVERQSDQFGIFDHDRSARDRRLTSSAPPKEVAEYLHGVSIPTGLLNTRQASVTHPTPPEQVAERSVRRTARTVPFGSLSSSFADDIVTIRRVAGQHDADPREPWKNTMADEPYFSLQETPDFADLPADGEWEGRHRVEDFRGPNDGNLARNPYTGDTETGRFVGDPEGRGHWDRNDRTHFAAETESEKCDCGHDVSTHNSRGGCMAQKKSPSGKPTACPCTRSFAASRRSASCEYCGAEGHDWQVHPEAHRDVAAWEREKRGLEFPFGDHTEGVYPSEDDHGGEYWPSRQVYHQAMDFGRGPTDHGGAGPDGGPAVPDWYWNEHDSDDDWDPEMESLETHDPDRFLHPDDFEHAPQALPFDTPIYNPRSAPYDERSG